jgi:hypothetical protein
MDPHHHRFSCISCSFWELNKNVHKHENLRVYLHYSSTERIGRTRVLPSVCIRSEKGSLHLLGILVQRRNQTAEQRTFQFVRHEHPSKNRAPGVPANKPLARGFTYTLASQASHFITTLILLPSKALSNTYGNVSRNSRRKTYAGNIALKFIFAFLIMPLTRMRSCRQ